MTYVLQPDGSIKNIKDKSKNLSSKEVKNLKGYLGYKPYTSNNESIEEEEFTFLTSKVNDVKKFVKEALQNDDLYTDRIELKKNDSFDFISPDEEEKIFSYSSFNDVNSIFAEEFEMLTGWTPVKDGGYLDNRLFPLFTFFADAFQKIALLEIITEANRFIFDDSNTAENYSFRYGSYSIKGIDIFSKFIFEKLNYPKEKMSFDERLASFVIGFAIWLKPDRVLDVDQLIKEASSEFQEDINNFLELTSKANILYNNPISMIVVPLVFYAVEVLLAINGSLEKRVKLLFNKFSMEKVWRQKFLYSNKSKDEESNESKFFAEFDLYSTKFYIERIHVGSKILRNVLQKASYMPLFLKENSFNRVAGGKFYKTTDTILANADNGSYVWEASRSKQQEYKFEQSTRIRALPQGLLLNKKIINDLFSNSGSESTPLVNIGEDLLQNFYIPNEVEGKRLPDSLVREIEEHLENEYMPFYFHDLRTNEILSFHAFLSSLTDNVNPNYSSVEGLGRVEKVQIYKGTDRKIDFTFHLVATSKKDFDLMWYQVNKLASMCYPQFTKGVSVTDIDEDTNKITKGDFSFPFSQVPAAAPIIRIRIGDVVKSNYSAQNISRLHEFENKFEIPGIREQKSTSDVKNTGPLDVLDIDAPPVNIPSSSATENIQTDINEFIREPSKEDETFVLLPGLYRDNTFTDYEYFPLEDIIQGYVNIKHPVEVKVLERFIPNLGKNKFVNVEIVDPSWIANEVNVVLTVDSRSIVNYFPKAVSNTGENNTLNQRLVDSLRNPKDATRVVGREDDVVGRDDILNNPITLSFDSGKGRGLAGFITSFSTGDFLDGSTTWETSEIGSRGPIKLKIKIGFAVISDITPGLDYSGMMRAPVWNLGRINNEFFGDVHDEVGKGTNSGLNVSKIGKSLKTSQEYKDR